MKINTIQLIGNSYNNTITKQAINKKTSSNFKNNSLNKLESYPKNFYLNFTAKRKAGQVQERYEELIPATVKTYIDNTKGAQNQSLTSIHKKVFVELLNCKTAEDVQKKFPDECSKGQWNNLTNFSNLEESAQKHSMVKMLLKAYDKDSKTADGQDLSVLILKNCYYDCKRINTFMRDVLPNCLNNTEEAEEIKALIDKAGVTTNNDYFHFIIDSVGIDLPNWNKYGSALTSYQHNISNDKEKYSMIDAWNNSEELRDELSILLKFYHKPSSDNLYDVSSLEDCDIVQFWNNLPDAIKNKYINEIQKAQKRYDKKSVNEDDFEEYKRELEKTSEKIRQKIQETNGELVSPKYPFASKFIFRIEEKINPFLIKSITRKDLYKIIFDKFSDNELNIIENKDSNSDEFRELMGIIADKKIETLKKDPTLYNIANSEKMAIKTVTGSNTEDSNGFATDIETQRKINDSYKENLKHPENNSDIDNIANMIAENAKIKPDDIEALKEFMSYQGNYILKALSDDSEISLYAQKLILEGFNAFRGTNYQNAALLKQVKLDNIRIAKDELMDIAFDYID